MSRAPTIPTPPWEMPDVCRARVTEIVVARCSVVRLEDIIDTIALAAGFTAAEMSSADGYRSLNEARQLAMFEAQAAGFSLAQIGKALNRNRSSVRDGVKREQTRRAKQ
ncbi:helix-turn-helix domain-containing protein [Pseudogemmobacter faecipullorum]|uniref:Chromosomal replication initiator DnaA n=1 Tax=Pseudogemmobacter faecipullorum TaxID=2755041 RepID=A0ABS8CQL7_9RHOB|nr:helix-turn-helix domain-containing protein [Pseudogemmobacter faecipullorum]MCB5411495.1 chromosomal replication initiator DnaA [Pseudogemmobacter faecipullorum]